MACLKFDDVDDRLRWTTLASSLSNISTGAWTVAALLKREAFATFDAVTYLLSSTGAGVTEAGFSINSADFPLVDVSGTSVGATTIADQNVRIICITKATGTIAPRAHYKDLTAATAWSHATMSGNIPSATAATMLDIGVWEATGDPFDGWIGLVGWWAGEMSDVQTEALSTNKKTSDWWSHAFGAPKFLAELNVAAGSVVDIAGNATVASHVNPTLDSGETMASWTWDGTGGSNVNVTGVVASATASGPTPLVNARPYINVSVS